MTVLGHKVVHGLAGVAFACAVLAGCGGAAGHASEAQVHADFARIQRHEASLADAGRRRAEGDCAARCGATEDGRRAAGEICDIAQRLQDADALRRCEAARHRAAGLPTGCSCPQ